MSHEAQNAPKQGPANHGAAHDEADLDAPTPPGGPQRQDATGATVTPGGAPDAVPDPEPEVRPSGTPDGPSTIPTPEDPVPDPDPQENLGSHDSTQLENAETSDDQPST